MRSFRGALTFPVTNLRGNCCEQRGANFAGWLSAPGYAPAPMPYCRLQIADPIYLVANRGLNIFGCELRTKYFWLQVADLDFLVARGRSTFRACRVVRGVILRLSR